MMFSDEEIKEIPDNSYLRPGDEIISIREVCLVDKYDKKDLVFSSESLLSSSGRNDLSQSQEADTSSSVFHSTSRNGLTFSRKPYVEPSLVSSTSNDRAKTGSGTCKVDKADPRSRFHYVKYVKRHGRTVKLWECGICSREFQHQYTLMRHLPTHTDERNFHCDACGKSFRQLSTLSQHRAIHSAERPYACEVCT
ncbi:zinc finger and SCAN domain-containing protein 22-like [Ostrinia nubilalis]|uniref:zinc finger and SCAN domain-containing protein 22-like n=1 Tax=Ostrinia nubilalis TaxID=29057 RepID=UPI0030825B7A